MDIEPQSHERNMTNRCFMVEKKENTCIWCGKSEPEVTFNNIAHILPRALGGQEEVKGVCDECNKYFGTAPKGKHGIPCMDHAFKEIFGAIRMFSKNLTSNSYKNFSSSYFTYRHSLQKIIIKKNFNSKVVTRQFKRALYEVFLQKYHHKTSDGHNPMFKMVRDFARYDKGNPHVFYGFNNIILSPGEDYMQHPYLPMSEKLCEDITKYGMFDFLMMGHHFYLEVVPLLANVHYNTYLQEQANNTIIRIRNNEGIYEFNDVMQIDFLMQRFNS